MFDPASLATAGGLVLLGFILGKVRRPLQRKASAYVCEGCSHGHSYHDKPTGKCSFNKQNSYGSVVYKCPCDHYTGNIPFELEAS